MKIARRFKFEAAHQLPYHDGACRRLHGHTYHLELELQGPVRPVRPEDPQSGFVVDFGLLDRLIKGDLLEPWLDHQYLNDHLPGILYPSAERLAAWILVWCLDHAPLGELLGRAGVTRVRLWETPRSMAEATPEEARQLFPRGLPLP
ncbi:MAG: 6-carboxytetrahydropterin synthase [Magnetococcales bacterium]|nr:6-carboxytetrahydropterin synthase [Magnetococcales bacterium]